MIALYIVLSVILLIYLLLRCSLVFDISLTPEESKLSVKYLFFNIYPKKEKVLTEKQKQRLAKKNKKKRAKLDRKLMKEKQKLSKKYAKLNKSKGVSAPQKLSPEDVKFGLSDKNEDKSVNETEKSADNKEEFSQEGKQPGNEQSSEKNNKKKKKSLKDRLAGYIEQWEKIKPHIPAGKKAVKKLIKSIRVDDLYLRYLVTDEDAYECAMKYGKTNMVVYDALGVLSALVTVRIKKIEILTKFNCDETDYELSCKVKTRPSTLLAISIACLFRVVIVYFRQSRKENKKGDVLNERSSN